MNFTVDKYTQHFRTKGESDDLDIDYEVRFAVLSKIKWVFGPVV